MPRQKARDSEKLVQTGEMLGLNLRRRIFAFAILLLDRTLWRIVDPFGRDERIQRTKAQS